MAEELRNTHKADTSTNAPGFGAATGLSVFIGVILLLKRPPGKREL